MRNKIILISMGVLFAILGLIILFTPDKTGKEYIDDTIELGTNLEDSVMNTIFALRLEHPYIVYAQAIVESGHFRSAIFLENKNMFGMRMPERRATLALGIRRGHAYYRSWQESLYDYAMFQSAYMRGLSEDEYFTRLSRSYAEDKEYERKVRLIKEGVKRKVKQ